MQCPLGPVPRQVSYTLSATALGPGASSSLESSRDPLGGSGKERRLVSPSSSPFVSCELCVFQPLPRLAAFRLPYGLLWGLSTKG